MQGQQKQLGRIEKEVEKIAKRIEILKGLIHNQNKSRRFIVGMCGIPGSGKSTVSALLAAKLNETIVLPMDGFHIFRKQLNQEGHKRRGAAFTFDLPKFQLKIQNIRNSILGQSLKYPSFSHEEKDPVEDQIQIYPETEIIIVEGLYVFDKNLGINKQKSDIWDFKIWVNCDIQTAIQRVAKRHLQSGIEATYQLAYQRATTNDHINAIYVNQNCFLPGNFQPISKLEQDNSEGIEIIIQNGFLSSI